MPWSSCILRIFFSKRKNFKVLWLLIGKFTTLEIFLCDYCAYENNLLTTFARNVFGRSALCQLLVFQQFKCTVDIVLMSTALAAPVSY